MTIQDFHKKKAAGEKIAMITCYDYTSARLIARSSIDCVLVGDSLGMVVSGYGSTIPVTMEMMSYHTECVRRGIGGAFIIGDMPFLSYQVSPEQAVQNAGLLLKSGANAVKIEGGAHFAPTVGKLTACSIPVCGHLGMTPQSVHAFGGFRVQGRSQDASERLLCDAKALESAGAFALVLELVPEDLARRITEEIRIPTIGIGAGRFCDGQVLVLNDVLGLDDTFRPRMVKRYMDGASMIIDSLDSYARDVKDGSFPAPENVFS